jgi:hypothetical protein
MSYATFEQARRRDMGFWVRVKMAWKKAFGERKVVRPFDPFAPEHCRQVA